MGEKKHGFEEVEVEQTSRWIEHKALQGRVLKWKIGIAVALVVGFIVFALLKA